jgi:hypothetical protein
VSLIAKTYLRGSPFDFRRAPQADVEVIKLFTQDGRELRGLYYHRGTPRAAALVMHPRVDFTRHYTIPRLCAAGVAVLGLTSRSPNDDSDLVHEELALDVAAGVDWLRARAPSVVLIGNSGGGALMALFQREARRAPEERIGRTPAGAPVMLPKAKLTPADGLILIAAHRGQGQVLLRAIDPSVIDEHDPSLTDPSIDMYDPDNGFRAPPEPSSYEAPFVDRYRRAQIDRVARLDAIAKALLAPSDRARRATKAPGFDLLPFAARQSIERALHLRRVMTVYRTMANLDYVDRSLDPSPRVYGSLLSDRPDLMNYSLPGFARTVTPRAWLSTWSGISSNADLVRCLAGITEPVLAIHAERDREIFPSDTRAIDAAIASEDRASFTIEGAGHYFEPEEGDDAPHVERAMDLVVPWIEERFAR